MVERGKPSAACFRTPAMTPAPPPVETYCVATETMIAFLRHKFFSPPIFCVPCSFFRARAGQSVLRTELVTARSDDET
jgi:hypothetical protein